MDGDIAEEKVWKNRFGILEAKCLYHEVVIQQGKFVGNLHTGLCFSQRKRQFALDTFSHGLS